MASIAAGVMASRKAVATACSITVSPTFRKYTPAAVTACGKALQQCRPLSHRASCLMRHGPDVGIEPRLIRLKGCPIDEAGMMILNENGPLIHGQMPNAFPDSAVFINVAFVLGLAVGVSASIHRISQDLVQRVVSRRYPADRARHSSGRSLQRKR